MSDKVRNPLTGRMISTTGRVYQQLVAAGTIQLENGSMNQAPAPQPASQPAVQFTSESIQPAVQFASESIQPIVIQQPTETKDLAERLTLERFGKSYERERIRASADTPEELFQNIQNEVYRVKSGDRALKTTVTISFTNVNDGSVRFVGVSESYWATLDDFMEFLENIRTGQIVGSDAVDSDEWELNLDSFQLGKIGYSDKMNGISAKIIYECEGVADKRPKTEKKEHYCVKKSLEHFGLTFDENLVVGGNYTALFESLDNKICHNNVVTCTLNSSMRKDGVKINGKYYIPITLEPFIARDGTVHPPVFQMDGPCDAKFVVDMSSDDMHMDVLTQPVRIKPNLYLDDSWKIVEIVDGKIKKNNRAELRRTVEAPQEKRPDYFLFFDFETHVDWDDRSCMKAYSLSTFLCTNEILVALEAADKAGNQEECERIRAANCKTYIGYDCATRFWDYFFQDSLDKNVHFVSFNGTYFDNMFLLRAFMEWRRENTAEYMIDKELFVNGGLLNMRIAKRHDFFDVAKHLLGSLKSLCAGFQVKCCAKRDFDHHEMQKLADNGTLFEFCNSDPKLREYNEYDVLSLAVIFARYRQALADIPASKAYAPELHTIPTIGSLSKKIWIDHVRKEYCVEKEGAEIVEGEDFNHEEPLVLAQNSRFEMPTKTDEEGNVRQVKLGANEHIFPKLPLNVYNAILDGKSAGRVQCFQGVTKFVGSIVSLDVCSLYPYILAVCPNYFPAGNIVETAPGEFHADLCGFYWINADQSNLQRVNRALILPVKARDHLGNITENNYNSRDGIITNCCVTHKDVLQLKKYGCRVEILGGFYFTHKVKSCDLFRPILDFMQAKNHQDNLKARKDPSYNAPMRETLKLFMNSLSGKIIEGLHLDKVVRASEKKLRELASKYEISCVTTVGDRECYVQYAREQEECIQNQSPVYLGAYVYAYARAHMYDYGYSHVGLKNLLYTDTDSIKFPSACIPAYQEATKDLVVPHWPEVLAYDARYAGHKLFDANSKVFGSFEDELDGLDNNVFYCVQKKVWCVAYDNGDGTHKNVKWRGKGFNSRSVLVADDFKITSQRDAQYFIHDSPDSVGISDMKKGLATNQVVLFERLFSERTATLLCSTFKKIIKNTRRNVAVDDASKHQQLFCRVQVCANLKKINIKEIERPICTVLDSEGRVALGF